MMMMMRDDIFRLWLVLMICQALLTHLSTIAFAPYIHALAVKKNIPFEQVITKGETGLPICIISLS